MSDPSQADRQAPKAAAKGRPQRARARPTTDKGCEEFVALCREGATEREAEAKARVNRHMVRKHPKYGPELAEAQGAYTAAQRRIVERVANGEVEDPKQARAMFAAASWLLSKRDRETYGDSNRTEITGADGGPLKTETTVVRFPVNKLGDGKR